MVSSVSGLPSPERILCRNSTEFLSLHQVSSISLSILIQLKIGNAPQKDCNAKWISTTDLTLMKDGSMIIPLVVGAKGKQRCFGNFGISTTP